MPLIEYHFMRVECLALRDLHVIMAPSDSLPAERAPLQYNQRPRNVFCCANAPSLTQKDEGREEERERGKKVNGFESEKLCPFVRPTHQPPTRSSMDDHLRQCVQHGTLEFPIFELNFLFVSVDKSFCRTHCGETGQSADNVGLQSLYTLSRG